MKHLLILIAILFITACSNDNTIVQNPEKETTLQLQKLAAADSTTYKVVEYQGTLYCINVKTAMVEKKMIDNSGILGTTLLILVIIVLVFVAALSLSNIID